MDEPSEVIIYSRTGEAEDISQSDTGHKAPFRSGMIFYRVQQQENLSTIVQRGSERAEEFLRLVSEGNVQHCETHLRKFPSDIHVTNKKRETPLHIATKHRHGSLLLPLFLKFKPNVNAKNFWGQTPLHYAADVISPSRIKLLLQEQDIDVNIRDVNGYTALHAIVACSSLYLNERQNWEEGFRTLVNAGLDVNAQTNYGHTILHLLSGRTDTVKYWYPGIFRFTLNECSGIQYDLKNYMGQTFMHSYIPVSADLDICKYMTERECAAKLEELMNERDMNGLSPSSMFLRDGSSLDEIEIAEIIRFGGSVNSKDNLANSALHMCNNYWFDEMVANGADVNSKNIFGVSAISNVSLYSDFFTKLDLSSNVNFAIKDRWGRTPLFALLNKELAQRRESMDFCMQESLHQLLQVFSDDGYDFDINAQDYFGTTLLHLAAYHDDSVAIEVLLDNGAKCDVADGEGDFPTDTAIKFGNVKSYQVLLEESNLQKSLSEYAEYYNSLEMVFLSDVRDLNCLHEVVRSVPEEKEAFSRELLSKHHIDFVDESIEAYHVTCAVQSLVGHMCDLVGEFDPRFKISFFRSGSSAEGTKIRWPDEFDFVLCLDPLKENCEIEMSTYPTTDNCACLKFKDTSVPDEFIPFSDEHHFFVSQPYLKYLFQYIQRALFSRSLWESGQLSITDSCGSLSFEAPVINFRVCWTGSKYKSLDISIDLVPAVYREGWWPPRYLPEKVDDNVRKAGCLVLLQSMTKHVKIDHRVMEDSISKMFLEENEDFRCRSRSYRISVAPAEIALMKSLPVSFRQAYALAKMFRSDRFVPYMVLDEPLKIFYDDMMAPSGEVINPAKQIKSYWIKNCLFYVAEEYGKELEFVSPFVITVKVYQKLLEFAASGVFRPFLQRCTNLFKFLNEGEFYRDGMLLHSVDRGEFRLECLHRKMCIEMVLAVLRCPVQLADDVKWLDLCEENYKKECMPALATDF